MVAPPEESRAGENRGSVPEGRPCDRDRAYFTSSADQDALRCPQGFATLPARKQPRPGVGHRVAQPRGRVGTRRYKVNQDQIWSQVQEELRFQLAKRTYDMWLKNTSVVSADGGTFRIGVPSKLAKDWLEDRFSGLIQETLQTRT